MKATKSSVLTLFLMALVTASASGQGPSPVPAKHTVIRAARILDVKTGQVIRDGAIVIAGDKIVSVGPGSGVSPGAGTVVINLPMLPCFPA